MWTRASTVKTGFLTVLLSLSVPTLLPSAVVQLVRETTVCRIGAQPKDFDGQLVRIRATVVNGFEIFGVRDPDAECTIGLTYPGGGPSAFLSIGGKSSTATRPPIVLRRDRAFKQFEKFLNAPVYPRERGAICMGCRRYQVTATMTGRIEVAPPGQGFGHMNLYDVQFVLQRVSSVSAKDFYEEYDPHFCPTPIRFPTGYLVGDAIGPNGERIKEVDVTAYSVEEVPLFLQEFTESSDEKG